MVSIKMWRKLVENDEKKKKKITVVHVNFDAKNIEKIDETYQHNGQVHAARKCNL